MEKERGIVIVDFHDQQNKELNKLAEKWNVN